MAACLTNQDSAVFFTHDFLAVVIDREIVNFVVFYFYQTPYTIEFNMCLPWPKRHLLQIWNCFVFFSYVFKAMTDTNFCPNIITSSVLLKYVCCHTIFLENANDVAANGHIYL